MSINREQTKCEYSVIPFGNKKKWVREAYKGNLWKLWTLWMEQYTITMEFQVYEVPRETYKEKEAED